MSLQRKRPPRKRRRKAQGVRFGPVVVAAAKKLMDTARAEHHPDRNHPDIIPEKLQLFAYPLTPDEFFAATASWCDWLRITGWRRISKKAKEILPRFERLHWTEGSVSNSNLSYLLSHDFQVERPTLDVFINFSELEFQRLYAFLRRLLREQRSIQTLQTQHKQFNEFALYHAANKCALPEIWSIVFAFCGDVVEFIVV